VVLTKEQFSLIIGRADAVKEFSGYFDRLASRKPQLLVGVKGSYLKMI